MSTQLEIRELLCTRCPKPCALQNSDLAKPGLVCPLNRWPEGLSAFKRASREVSEWVKEGAEFVDEKEVTARLSICKGCSHCVKGVCQLCSCLLFAKARLKGRHCPIQKW